MINTDAIITAIFEGSTPLKIIITLVILFFGFILARLISRLIYTVSKPKEKDHHIIKSLKGKRRWSSNIIEYALTIITILIALIYLNAPLTNELFTRIIDFIPTLISAALIIILGFVVVNLIMDILGRFFETVRMKEYVSDIGLSPKILDGLMFALKILLYIIVLKVAITQLIQYVEVIQSTLTVIFYAIVAIMVVLAFFGFRGIIENYAAGVYLKNTRMVKPGERVKIENETGDIRTVGSLGTVISTMSGYFMLVPNKILMNKPLFLKRTRAEVETLEDIKDYFSAQDPSYCGPASAEMALAVFGFTLSQKEIGKHAWTRKPGGTLPENLIKAVEKLTKEEIKGAYIDYNHISNLRNDIRAWLNDGALIILNFMKPIIFPNATTGHYALCLGVEGDELLVIDPSSKTGGVYYVNHSDMLNAMAEHGKKRGYIVLAPKGTTGYWRIQEGLIYSDISFYDKLSKSLEMHLYKIMRRSRIVKSLIPKSVELFIEKWRVEDKVERLWKPLRKRRVEDKQINEFTDNKREQES